MGKVKELWQEERDRRFELRVNYLMREQLYTHEEACEQAMEEEEERDRDNSQFGVGA